MTPERKQEILEKIRQEHKIAIDEDDPMFAIITANEVVFEDYMSKQNIMFAEHLANMETSTENYLTRAKELAEVKISNAVEEAYQKIEEFRDEAKAEIEVKEESKTKQSIPILYWVMLLFAVALGYGIGLVLI